MFIYLFILRLCCKSKADIGLGLGIKQPVCFPLKVFPQLPHAVL